MNHERTWELSQKIDTIVHIYRLPMEVVDVLEETVLALREASLYREFFPCADTATALGVMESREWVADLIGEHHPDSVRDDDDIVYSSIDLFKRRFLADQSAFVTRLDNVVESSWSLHGRGDNIGSHDLYEIFESTLGAWMADQSAKLRLSPKGFTGFR